eukprot:328158-Chlamydomonas_euryale.AAC.1
MGRRQGGTGWGEGKAGAGRDETLPSFPLPAWWAAPGNAAQQPALFDAASLAAHRMAQRTWRKSSLTAATAAHTHTHTALRAAWGRECLLACSFEPPVHS